MVDGWAPASLFLSLASSRSVSLFLLAGHRIVSLPLSCRVTHCFLFFFRLFFLLFPWLFARGSTFLSNEGLGGRRGRYFHLESPARHTHTRTEWEREETGVGEVTEVIARCGTSERCSLGVCRVRNYSAVSLSLRYARVHRLLLTSLSRSFDRPSLEATALRLTDEKYQKRLLRAE